MNKTRRLLITLLVILTCIGCDQATKTIASHKLAPSAPITLIDHIFHLEYTENSGAMMGVGAELSNNTRFWLFTVFAGCALFAILAFTLLDKTLNVAAILSLSLIVGGGLGNLVDRLFKRGIVVDFMIITLGPLKTAIFNFADLSILIGLLVLAFSHMRWFSHSPQDNRKG
ncbi:MAG: signal peptidase II [Bacteroidota bacterium]